MIKLKLIKGLSYRGGIDGKVKATKASPFCSVETMEEAQAAVASGYFQIVEGAPVPPSEPPKDPGTDSNTEKDIEKMTKDELVAYAEELGIDISKCKNNDERKEAIKNALEEAGPKVPFEEE